MRFVVFRYLRVFVLFPVWILASLLCCSLCRFCGVVGFCSLYLFCMWSGKEKERSSRVLQHGNPKSWIFFKKAWNWILSVPREKKSPWLRRYQSYISNWFINGKVFAVTTALKPKMLNFLSKKFEIDKIEFCPHPGKRNRPGFVDISPTLVIDSSMERSSLVLQHGNTKSLIFSKKIQNWLNWILSVPWEKKSPWLRRYQVWNWILTCILTSAEELKSP